MQALGSTLSVEGTPARCLTSLVVRLVASRTSPVMIWLFYSPALIVCAAAMFMLSAWMHLTIEKHLIPNLNADKLFLPSHVVKLNVVSRHRAMLHAREHVLQYMLYMVSTSSKLDYSSLRRHCCVYQEVMAGPALKRPRQRGTAKWAYSRTLSGE